MLEIKQCATKKSYEMQHQLTVLTFSNYHSKKITFSIRF